MRKYETKTKRVLEEWVDYDPDTGVLTWKQSKYNAKAGEPIGYPTDRGWLRFKFNGYHLRAHRVCWYLAHGTWPEAEIDHINGIRHDNRLCNLRCATRSENARNTPRQRGGVSPYKALDKKENRRARDKQGHCE